ncbi:MAG: anion permease [Ignavibacteria bacterium]|nr:anion permease [Ignavibacteria bacterium]
MKAYTKVISSILPAVLVYFVLSGFTTAGASASKMAAVAVLMAALWLSEAVPVAVTALLPAVLFPVFGILDSKQTSMQYMDPIIFLFIGGFILAFGIEKWMLHERISLRILMSVGSKPSHILLGVMITTFIISMWISNTATVMMLYASVMAIILKIENNHIGKSSKGIATALLLGLAYSASIGGMSTLVGTPTNMIFYRMYKETYPLSNEISFFSWFIFAIPIAVILLFITFALLKFMFIKKNESLAFEKNYFRESYTKLGKISYEEKFIGIIFIITAVLWFTRADIEIGSLSWKGWNNFSKVRSLLLTE